MTGHTNQQVTAPSISGYALLSNGSNALRCFGSSSFALGNYPTYCMYRRGHQVNAKSRIQQNQFKSKTPYFSFSSAVS